MHKPLVTIITPSLNQGNFIEDTIRSVLEQTHDNIEYLIMDGGSTDNTLEVIDRYSDDPRLVLYSEKDEGQYDAVNRGFALASGEIIGWINADDIYTRDALEKMISVFNESVDTEVVYGRLHSFSVDDGTRRQLFCREFSYKWLRRYCFTNPSVTFIRSSVIKQDRFFIDTTVPTYGDWDWYLRMAEHGKKFSFLSEPIGYFRIHPGSRIMRMGHQQSLVERTLIMQRHGIPLSYMTLWIDNIVPWIERLGNFFILLKENRWQQIAIRSVNVSRIMWRQLMKKLV
jgi:glycosyltransferase involved in cell wall biosynthesis